MYVHKRGSAIPHPYFIQSSSPIVVQYFFCAGRAELGGSSTSRCSVNSFTYRPLLSLFFMSFLQPLKSMICIRLWLHIMLLFNLIIWWALCGLCCLYFSWNINVHQYRKESHFGEGFFETAFSSLTRFCERVFCLPSYGTIEPPAMRALRFERINYSESPRCFTV